MYRDAQVGVIITLVSLAVQIRQSSSLVAQNIKLLDVSVANSIRDAQNEVSRILACDQRVAGIWWQGLVTASEETLLTLRWTRSHPGGREWWAEYRSLYTEHMQAFVEDLNGD